MSHSIHQKAYVYHSQIRQGMKFKYFQSRRHQLYLGLCSQQNQKNQFITIQNLAAQLARNTSILQPRKYKQINQFIIKNNIKIDLIYTILKDIINHEQNLISIDALSCLANLLMLNRQKMLGDQLPFDLPKKILQYNTKNNTLQYTQVICWLFVSFLHSSTSKQSYECIISFYNIFELELGLNSEIFLSLLAEMSLTKINLPSKQIIIKILNNYEKLSNTIQYYIVQILSNYLRYSINQELIQSYIKWIQYRLKQRSFICNLKPILIDLISCLLNSENNNICRGIINETLLINQLIIRAKFDQHYCKISSLFTINLLLLKSTKQQIQYYLYNNDILDVIIIGLQMQQQPIIIIKCLLTIGKLLCQHSKCYQPIIKLGLLRYLHTFLHSSNKAIYQLSSLIAQHHFPQQILLNF